MKCGNCGTEIDTSEFETGTHATKDCDAIRALRGEIAETSQWIAAHRERCYSAGGWDVGEDNLPYLISCLRGELVSAEGRAEKLVEALKWYADEANNGKQDWVQIDGVAVSKHRWIDEDEGEVAREALARHEEAKKDA